MSNKVELSLHTWEEIKKIFFQKNFDNVILFSQPRSGSTFASYVLSKELNYEENFFPEEFFINKHFSYLRHFIRKHDNFFLNVNEYWYRRTDLIKNNTMYLYLYRDSEEILNSYKKAKRLNYYLGWKEMIDKYRTFFPEIQKIEPAPLVGHKVWEKQIKKFNNGYTLSYKSFKTHRLYLEESARNSRNQNLKDIEMVEKHYIKKKFTDETAGKNPYNERYRVKFNTLEKFYFFVRRKLESKKKSRKNY
jgi:hypothetical protein